MFWNVNKLGLHTANKEIIDQNDILPGYKNKL